MDALIQLLGKLHPVVLHFPLVLVLLGAIAELARRSGKVPQLAGAAGWLLGLGALSAVISGGTGWVLAAHEHIRSDQRETLAWHRWLGVATAVISCAAWLVPARTERSTLRTWFALAAALLILATGFFGGELVWGRDWFRIDEAHEHG